MSAAFVLLALVALQRLAELVIARRNTARLLAEGAVEVGAGHYPLIVAVHAGWLIALFAWIVLVPIALSIPILLLYLLLQGLRVWVMMSLGRYWTTRIIVPREAMLVRRGPYKFLRHPNYTVVVLEIAVLPLVIGAWPIAVVFSLLNALVLWVRISAENRSLAARPTPV